MKIQKISANVLYVCFALIAVVLVLFYCVGFDNMSDDGEHNAPQFTEALMFLMYGLAAATALVTVWSFASSLGHGVDDAKTGVAGSKVTLATVAILAASIGIGFAVGSSDPVTLTDGTQVGGFTSLGSEAIIIAMYLLAALSTVFLIISLAGVIKK